MSIDIDDANRFAKFATAWRAIEHTYEAKVAEQKQQEMEEAVENGEEDETIAKQKNMKAKSAWKTTNKVWAGHNCRRLMRPGSHEAYVWDSAAHWKLPNFCNTYDFVVPYLEAWGLRTDDVEVWPTDVVDGPIFDISLDEGSHEEHSGHTWYLLSCSVKGLPGTAMLLHPWDTQEEHADNSQLTWRAPRRLSQIRADLHDPIKELLQERYAVHFADAPFARHGAPPGTTARLAAWLRRLALLVSNRTLSPLLVARTLVFCNGPPLTDPHTDQATDELGVCALRESAEAAEKLEDQVENQSKSGSSASSERPDIGNDNDNDNHIDNNTGEGSLPVVTGEVEVPATAGMSQTFASKSGVGVAMSAAVARSPLHNDLLGLEEIEAAGVPATPGSRFRLENDVPAASDFIFPGEDEGVRAGDVGDAGQGQGQQQQSLQAEAEAEVAGDSCLVGELGELGEFGELEEGWEVGEQQHQSPEVIEAAATDLDEQANKYAANANIPADVDGGLKVNTPTAESAVFL